MLEENCRGHNPNTPIGEIAEHAFKHWQRHEQEVDKLKRVIRHNGDLLEVEKEKVAEARRTACDYQEIINEKERQERHQKYKRCMAMARWCASRSASWCLDPADEELHKSEFYEKWKLHWRQLAEKFKEAK